MNYIQRIQHDFVPKIDLTRNEGQLFDLYTLLLMTKGKETTMEDIHDAWSIWMNRKDDKHRSLIPFNELTKEIQEYDREYMEAVHSATKK